MAPLQVGDSFPEGVTFSYVPYTEEKSDIAVCGIPVNYDASKGMSSLLSLTLQPITTSALSLSPSSSSS
jgi:hypothetical protein